MKKARRAEAVPLLDKGSWWDGRPMAVLLVDLPRFLERHGLRVVSRFDPEGTGWDVEVVRDGGAKADGERADGGEGHPVEAAGAEVSGD